MPWIFHTPHFVHNRFTLPLKKCKRFWIEASSQDLKTNAISEPHSALLLPLSCGLEHCCLRLFNCLSSGAHAHFLERSYISPSPLSCRHYIVSVVKNGDRKGGAFTRIQIDPFCAAPTAASPSQLPKNRPERSTRGLSRFVETISRLSRNKDMNA